MCPGIYTKVTEVLLVLRRSSINRLGWEIGLDVSYGSMMDLRDESELDFCSGRKN